MVGRRLADTLKDAALTALDGRMHATASGGLGALLTGLQKSTMSQLDMIRKYRKMIHQDRRYVLAFHQLMDIYESSHWKGLFTLALIAGDELEALLLAVMHEEGDQQLTELLDDVEQTALQVPVLRDTWLRIRKQMEGFGHSLMERGEIELANYGK